MYDIPKSVERWYKLWINQFPESWHPSDLERFYIFVSVLVHRAHKSRDRYWLEKNMRAERPQLSENDIEAYCDLFERLRDFSNVWKSQQASLVAEDTLRKQR
jgi:hypothetical protein